MDAPRVETFGDVLRRYRLAAGLTQEELAGRAQVSPRAISDLERGARNRPWRETIQLLAEALQLGPADRAQLSVAARNQGALSAPKPVSSPALAASTVVRTNLTVSPTPLIGRERELVELQRRLLQTDVRLLTLTGPGGIGKTRLALQLAADLLAAPDAFPDGVFVVSLAPIRDHALVPSTIAQAVGVETAGKSAADALKSYLRDRQLLLLLDNFEHVLPAAPVVADLLGGSSYLKVLVTSRAVLHLRGEREYAVPPLALPRLPAVSDEVDHVAAWGQYAAVRLFVERVQDVRSDFELTRENAQTVVGICARLDGLPLAIELAAARTRLLSPSALLARLETRLPLLAGGAQDLPDRQRTLRTTIAWSYDLLSNEEKALFRRLSVFVGGWTLDAAEAVCAMSNTSLLVDEGLESLLGQSLVRRAETVGGEARFTMLETIREYGQTLLAESGEDTVIQDRHVDYYRALVDEAVHLNTSEGPRSRTGWDARLIPEPANVRAALTWCRANDPDRGIELAAGLGWFWIFHQRDAAEGEAWLETFLAQAAGAPGVRGRALLALATLKRDRGYLAAAQPLFEEALALCRQVDDKWGIARSLEMLGQQARTRADYDAAIRLAEESLKIAREIRVHDCIIWTLTSLGQYYRFKGDFDRSRAWLEEAWRVAPGDWDVLYRLGMTEENAGAYARAEKLYQEALDRSRQVTSDICGWLLLLGRLARKQGDGARARRLIEEGLTVARQYSSDKDLCWALYDLAEQDWLDGRPLSGHARFAEALGVGQRNGDLQIIARGLLIGARYAADRRELIRAVSLFGAADRAMPDYQFEQDSFEVTDYVHSLAAVRASLDRDSFAAAWAEGQAMTLEEAVAYALAEDG